MVPDEWVVATLDAAGVKVIDGDRGKEYPKDADFSENGYCLFLSAKNVTKSGFKFDDIQFIDAEKDRKLRKGRVNRGNLVLTTRGSVGQFAHYDDSVPYKVMRINSGMVVLDADVSNLLPKFLYALCRSRIIQKQIEAASFGSAQPQLTVGIVKRLKLPIPPLREQKRIAEILSAWDKAITTTEQLLANSQQQKKALMQQLLTGKKRLLDKNGVRFGGEWSTTTFGKACVINPARPPEPNNGLVSFVAMENVSEDAKLINHVEKRYTDVAKGFTSFIDGDVVVAKITPCFENGKGAYIEGMKNGIGFGSTEFHVLRSNELSDSKFIYYLTTTSEFRVRGEANMQGSAGQKRVTTEYLRSYKIKIPLLEEQQKIASVLSVADQDIAALQKKLDALKQEKKALMQQLLTGKRRVKT
jgi:type I restriction enzyme S subunit